LHSLEGKNPLISSAPNPPSQRLPADVAAIREAAAEFERHRGERERIQHIWTGQVNRLEQISPHLMIEDGGDTIRLGALSPGCRACKDGKWDCLFLSMECNLSCTFCLTPCGIGKGTAISAFGDDLDALCAHYASSGTSGIGFSGGEPLLYPRLLLSCLSRIRQKLPHLYLWVYTNGTLLTRKLIEALAGAGLDELRFNTAATGYDNGHVIAMLRHGAAILPTVTVEIPAVPEDAESLREAIPVWRRAGVKHLNIHELIYEPGSPSEAMPGGRERCRMPDGHLCDFNPRSFDLVAEVMRDAPADAGPLALHFCSLQSKARQMRGRRLLLAPRTLQSYERLCRDGQAESICCFSGADYAFIHPDMAADMKPRAAGFETALVRRLLPLNRHGAGQWTRFEIIQPSEGA
jgi:pyruvate formate-lyase activating enzyme-like uncharacterized protein